MSSSTFAMLGKFSKKLGLSQSDKELASELNDMQERYSALKQSHDLALQMLSKSKETDNSLSEAYKRLQNQFKDLSLYVAIKRSEDFDKLKSQQDQISKQKDALDAKELELSSREKQLALRAKYLEMFESGISIDEIISEHQELKEEKQKLLKTINTLQTTNQKLYKNKEKVKTTLESKLDVLKKAKDSLASSYKEIEDLKEVIQKSSEAIMQSLKAKISSFNSKEEKKIDKVLIRKSVLPASFKKKNSINKTEDVDLEQFLGNSLNPN